MSEAQQIQEILIRLVHIDEQLNRLVSDAESEKEVRKRIIADHEARIRKVEDFVSNLKGRMFATGVLAGGVISLLIWLITKK